MNPDPVFFNELDHKLIENIKAQGAEVIECTIDKIYVEMLSTGIQIYYDSKLLEVDGMLCYGYMSPLHMQTYLYLVSAFENQGKMTLHDERVSRILDNKYLQGIHYSKAHIPIPETFTGFNLTSVRDIYKKNITDRSIIKSLSDYGGDGVKLSKHPDEGVTTISKMFWNNVQTLT